MSVNEVDPAAMEPLEYARLVKRASAGDLKRLMSGERRGAVLDELVRRMPSAFRADRAGAIHAVIHWNIGDRPDDGTDTYEMVIVDGACAVSPVPHRRPTLTLALGAVDFLNLVTGNAHPVVLVMRGTLKTKGDVALAAKFSSLFDVPKP